MNTAVLRFAFPLLAVGSAAWAASTGWGLLHQITMPVWLEIALSFVLLDLLVWGQHVAMHHIPLLWRLHRVHHSDRDFDATTGVRFHPIEIAFSMGLKMGFVIALGAPVISVIIFEIVLSATSLFTHANLHLPAAIDRVLRWLIVTPDMHRIHHSIRREETDSNYGFNFSVWDRLFRTYRRAAKDGDPGLTIGLPPYQQGSTGRLGWALALPFARD